MQETEEKTMDYKEGYVYDLMDQGGPTDNREPYFKEAVEFISGLMNGTFNYRSSFAGIPRWDS